MSHVLFALNRGPNPAIKFEPFCTVFLDSAMELEIKAFVAEAPDTIIDLTNCQVISLRWLRFLSSLQIPVRGMSSALRASARIGQLEFIHEGAA